MSANPTRDRLLDLFHVDVDAGLVTWRRSQGRAKAGNLAGGRTVHGYRRVNVDGLECKTHSIIYFIAYGEWPSLIDHINGDRSDNRVSNLRLANRAANARNRTTFIETKLPGAHHYGADKFAAILTTDGKQYRLGVFETETEAHEEYVRVRRLIDQAERQARVSALEEVQAERMTA